MKKAKFKMTGNAPEIEKSFESSCLCASLLKKDAGVVEGDFNTETQRLRGTEFKMTEMGLIPEDWEVKRLGEIASFETATIDVKNIDSEWYIGTENMVSGKAGIEKNLTSIPYRLVREYKVGDVLISNIRPYLKKIWLADRDGGCSSDVLVVRTLDSSVCLPTFLKMLLSDDLFFDFVMANAVGTKMPRGDKKVIVNYEVCLPPLAEQKKIAEALSDVDELLAAMTTLIEKKRAIKQGAMQELLGIRNEELGIRNFEVGAKKVPRRRLPGFSGEWVEKRLGDVCSITTGHKDVNEGCENGLYPFFTCSRNVLTSNHYSFDTEAILVAGNGDVGNLHYYCGKFEAYQRTYVLSDFMIYARYLWYELQFNLMNRLNDGKIGSTIPYIVLGQLLNYNFRIPPTLGEQRKIAEVLSDMDTEIEALEAKRAKYESIKQGMMQELLTGKTRLKGV